MNTIRLAALLFVAATIAVGQQVLMLNNGLQIHERSTSWKIREVKIYLHSVVVKLIAAEYQRPTIPPLLCQNGKMPGDEKPAATFENGLQELEKIVKEMEGADLPLERALELFEKGMRLSEACRKQLEEAETRIEVLVRKGNKIQAEPFQPDKA